MHLCIISTERALVQLQSDINTVKGLTGKFGSNRLWTNPSLGLWSLRGSINDIHDMIQLRVSVS